MSQAGSLDLLLDAGAIGTLDYRFARMLQSLSQAGDESVLLAAALASRAAAEGHVCLDLRETAGAAVGETGVLCPPFAEWTALLQASGLVAAPGGYAPLVLEPRSGWLYLHRYWSYEASLAAWMRERAASAPPPFQAAAARDAFARLFPEEREEPDWQKAAAVAALTRRLCVITGGPGTGKTTVAGRILDLLAAVLGGVRAVLAAPTGKAADRLAQAIGDRPGVRASGGTTVHRLLSELRRGRAGKPDIVVLDEASMADIALLAALTSRLPPATRLLLLGDRDQLASVEAGAVLGDLCAGPADLGGPLDDVPYSEAFCRDAEELAGLRLPRGGARARLSGPAAALRDAVVALKKSWRFDPSGGIGALSRAVNGGDAEEALRVLRAGGEAQLVPSQSGLAERVVAGFAPYLRAAGPEEAFLQHRRFCVLGALRRGPSGVVELNRWIEARLAAAGLVRPGRRWYPGLPVLVTRNDHVQRLYNGDVGLVFAGPGSEELRAWFAEASGGLRAVSPSRLPDHEAAYALTVHKSQGSEFDEVVLVLPPEASRVLTRELLYTAITRARKRVEIWGSEAVVRGAIEARTERRSGLRDALWGQ